MYAYSTSMLLSAFQDGEKKKSNAEKGAMSISESKTFPEIPSGLLFISHYWFTCSLTGILCLPEQNQLCQKRRKTK
jgi:hypothetical protein